MERSSSEPKMSLCRTQALNMMYEIASHGHGVNETDLALVKAEQKRLKELNSDAKMEDDLPSPPVKVRVLTHGSDKDWDHKLKYNATKNGPCFRVGFKQTPSLAMYIDMFADQAAALIELLRHSPMFASRFCWRFRNVSLFQIYLVEPVKQLFPYSSSNLISVTLWQAIELEDALHWLSTLGGAYSNLGEHSHDFAVRAGQNAFKQMRIALRSEDPSVAFRCWLYVAMSAMQQSRRDLSRDIIRYVYRTNVAVTNPDKRDDKVIRMCLGIWSRLKHKYMVAKEEKKRWK